MNKAIFLDRDGVINRERGEYTWRVEDFEINAGLADFLKLAQDKGYLLIVISNQGGIQRGVYTLQDVEIAHAYMRKYLKERGVELTEVYFCPHHQNTERCFCRKPQPIMLEKAIARFHIDTRQSIFFGDSSRDVEAGLAAGVPSVQIPKNSNLMQYASRLV